MNELRPKNWSRFFGVTCCLALLMSFVVLPLLIFGLGNQAQILDYFSYIIDYITCSAFYRSCGSFNYELSALSIVTLCFPLIAVAICFAITTFLLKSYNSAPQYTHLSGPNVLRKRKAFKHANKWHKRESGQGGIYLHPKITISVRRELGNIFVFGQQGAGKSTIIKYMLAQLLKRNDSLFIYDEKREYTEQFFTGNEVLISPGDKRSAAWEISKDITDEASAKAVASVLIQGSTQDKFWTDAAQVVLTGILITLMKTADKWTWLDLKNLAFSDAQTLHRLFELHYKPGINLVEPDSKTSLSILTTLAIQLSWLPDLASKWENSSTSFSLQSWDSTKNARRIIVAGNPISYDMSAAICSALLSLLANKIIASADSDTESFWFVLDELGNMPKTESLIKLLTLGRSKGVRTIAGTQAVSQVRSIYGNEDAETMLSLFSNIITLRTGPIGDSTKVASESMGTKRIQQRVKSFDSNGKESINFQQSDVAVVTAEEIVHLPRSSRAVSGYLLINGYEAIYRLDWPIQKRHKIAESFVPNESNENDSRECLPNGADTKNRLRRRR
jgi:type IV secretory pathway TraG/TraD family ATPase VirD4